MGTLNLKRYRHECQKDFDLLCLLFCDLSSGIISYIYFFIKKWDVTMISDFVILWFPLCALLLFLELFLSLILFFIVFCLFYSPVCLVSKEGEKKSLELGILGVVKDLRGIVGRGTVIRIYPVYI